MSTTKKNKHPNDMTDTELAEYYYAPIVTIWQGKR